MAAKIALKYTLLALAATSAAAGPTTPKASTSKAAASSSAAAPVTTPTAAYPNNYPWKNQYPPLFDKTGAWAVPPIDSTQAKEWIALVNMSAVPNAPVIKWDKNGNPIDPYPAGQNPYCDWSLDGVCTRPGDVVVCPQKGVWGLTFDDGPTPFGSQLYDWMGTQNLKATLFYIGLQVAQNPQVAQKGCAAGHQIAIHTWSHHVLTSLTNEQIIVELKWTETIIKEVCGVTPKYFRPPQGDYDDRVRSIASQLGYTAILWDLDTNDWMFGSPGNTLTPAQVDGNFTKWIGEESNDTHGHICLEHELSQQSVDSAKQNLPKLAKAYNIMPVASCIGDAHPYKESDISFPVIGTDGKLTSTNTSTSASPSNATASATDSGAGPTSNPTVSAAGAAGASSSLVVSATTTPSAGSRTYLSETLFAIAVAMAVTMAL
ncbi:hypothetical protein BC938DRAFT_481539 [Jimgerdemannia flammicorona]|uniref:NodB homology domain-containing protein n=1 Tax=Jimgerdemannia flammicorona TaxID=994334 RepID=A0A433QG02_9FUNG|nr:hypothetical protein BC938DRAFT_481539 [Jimgerdemannia flammicorona]